LRRFAAYVSGYEAARLKSCCLTARLKSCPSQNLLAKRSWSQRWSAAPPKIPSV